MHWFRLEAEMLQWRTQFESKIAQLLRVRRSFLKYSQTWSTVAEKEGRDGFAPYAMKTSLMYGQLARRAEEKLSSSFEDQEMKGFMAHAAECKDEDTLIPCLQEWRVAETDKVINGVKSLETEEEEGDEWSSFIRVLMCVSLH